MKIRNWIAVHAHFRKTWAEKNRKKVLPRKNKHRNKEQ